jgi:ferritin-like metal-binding protein YciE
MAAKNLQELLIEELTDIYDAEHQITEALPKMAKAATSAQLKKGFENHLKETENQIKQLNQVFELLDEKAKRKACPAMKGLLKEGQETMQELEGEVLDAALIVSAQKVEHYEMAAYGSVRTYARLMGHDEAADILQTILDQEGATDEKLTSLAQKLNAKAMS